MSSARPSGSPFVPASRSESVGPVDEFEHERGAAVRVLEAVDAADIRMVQ